MKMASKNMCFTRLLYVQNMHFERAIFSFSCMFTFKELHAFGKSACPLWLGACLLNLHLVTEICRLPPPPRDFVGNKRSSSKFRSASLPKVQMFRDIYVYFLCFNGPRYSHMLLFLFLMLKPLQNANKCLIGRNAEKTEYSAMPDT